MAAEGGFHEAGQRCRVLLSQMPPMEGSIRYKRTWSIEEALEQHQCLMRQHELQSSIGRNHVQVRKIQAEFAQLEAQDTAIQAQEALAGAKGSGGYAALSGEIARALTERASA